MKGRYEERFSKRWEELFESSNASYEELKDRYFKLSDEHKALLEKHASLLNDQIFSIFNRSEN